MKTKLVGFSGNQALVKKNIRSRPDEQYCPRPEAGCQFFRQYQQRNNLNGNTTPPHIRINRGLVIFIYRKKGSFYRPNICTVFNSILSSEFISTKWQLVKICHVSINLSSYFIATSRGNYPIENGEILKWRSGEMVGSSY